MISKLIFYVIFIAKIHNVFSANKIINYYEEEKDSFPCSFFDTVNITDGITNADGSVTHNDITYSQNHFRFYDYAYNNITSKYSVGNHKRGCICKYRKCIRSCCKENEVFDFDFSCVYDEYHKDFNVTINHDNGIYTHHNLLHDKVYGLTYVKTCRGYPLEHRTTDLDTWNLTAVFNIFLKNYEIQYY